MTTYRTLGRTGVQVTPLALGTMNLGHRANGDHSEGIAIVHAALDAGVNLVDTADVYSKGESEEIVGKALAGGRRDQVVLATKFHGRLGEGPNERGNSRLWITRAVENSLRRLGTDRIDVYQVHRPDADTDIEETVGALSDLVRAGKILYYGTSTFPAEQIVEAQWAAERLGAVRPSTEQPPYSIVVRGGEAAALPAAEKYGLGVLAWSPLGGGWLSGKFSRGRAEPLSPIHASRSVERHDLTLPANIAKRAAVDALDALAEEAGIPLSHLAIAFVLRHPAVTSAIIGPRTHEQLTGLLGSDEVVISDDVLDRIDQIVPPGVTLNSADGGFVPFAVAQAARRRR